MPRIASPLLLGSAVILLGACASTPPATVLVESHRACPLELQTGQTLIINLPSNPASGYRWRVHEAAAEVLEPLGPEVFRNGEGDIIGGDGISTWRFQVTGPGVGHLQLGYEHAWEAGAEPAASFDCRVRVR